MYEKKQDLCDDLKKAWNHLLTYKVVNKKYVLENLVAIGGYNELAALTEYGWLLYQNTYRNNLDLLLLGSRDIRKDEDLLVNFGTTSVHAIDESRRAFIGESMRHLKRRMEQTGFGDMQGYDRMSTTQGSILGESRWVPVLNDIWLVAGCHRLSAFYIGALKDGTMWSKTHDRPRILGREIIGLLACGYAMIDDSGKTGMAFVPVDRNLAQGATLAGIGAAASEVKSLGALKWQIRTATIARDKYLTWDVKPPSPSDLKNKIVRVVDPIIGYGSPPNPGGPLQYGIGLGRVRLSGDVARLDGMFPQDFIGVCILGNNGRDGAQALRSLTGQTTVQVQNPSEVMYVYASVILSSNSVIVE